MNLREQNISIILNRYSKEDFFKNMICLEELTLGTKYNFNIINLHLYYKGIFNSNIILENFLKENQEVSIDHYISLREIQNYCSSGFVSFLVELCEYNFINSRTLVGDILEPSFYLEKNIFFFNSCPLY